MTDLTSLIEKLEKAEGPDRFLDARICWALGLEPWAGTDEIHLTHFGIGSRIDKRTPAYTSSIDAAVSLAERVLPGCRWELTTTGYKPGASLVTDVGIVGAYGSTPAIALVLATLRALQSKGGAQ